MSPLFETVRVGCGLEDPDIDETEYLNLADNNTLKA